MNITFVHDFSDKQRENSYIRSNHNIPEKIIKNFNRKSAGYAGSGLYRFHGSIYEFQMGIAYVKRAGDTSFQAFSLEQLSPIFISYLVGMATASLFFLSELWQARKRSGHQATNTFGCVFDA